MDFIVARAVGHLELSAVAAAASVCKDWARICAESRGLWHGLAAPARSWRNVNAAAAHPRDFLREARADARRAPAARRIKLWT